MTYDHFKPFYCRLISSRNNGFVEKFLFSFFLGLVVLCLHFIAIDNIVFHNYGWILSFIITIASLSLYYATFTFKRLFPLLNNYLEEKEKKSFLFNVKKDLSDSLFIFYGFIFAILNCFMGIIFGLPQIYESLFDKIVIISSYFLAGFICGVALCGIVGVSNVITNLFLTDEHSFVDYTADDKCGGTQFIGWALITFSLVTLIVGVLISSYISFTCWENKDSLLVNLFYYGWICLPYIASIFVLIIPSISINKLLTRYKIEENQKLSDRITEIFLELENKNISAERKDELYRDYQFQKNMRATLYQMRTWPFGFGANLTYFLSICGSIFGAVTNINNWLQ